MLTARHRGFRRGRDRRARVWLDRDRGRPPAMGRLQPHAHQGRGDRRQRRLGHVLGRARPLHRAGRRDRVHPADDGAPLAGRGNRGGGRALRAQRASAPRRWVVHPRADVSTADAVAAVLWVGATLYAVFGGADFGAGFWALIAGRGERGDRARTLVDWAIGPVWEANHVWLIFVLVVLWTAFSVAFSSIMSTLFIPLSLAAFGIVLRGSGFAFHKMAHRLRNRQLAERAFGVSSLVTPFFMGTV